MVVFRPHPIPRDPSQDRNWSARQFRELASDSSEKERQILAVLDFAIRTFVVAIYGSVRMSTQQAGTDITATYQALDRMDQVVIAARLMKVDAPGVFEFDYSGVYNLQTEMSFQHNESNQGRSLRLRLFNITDSAINCHHKRADCEI